MWNTACTLPNLNLKKVDKKFHATKVYNKLLLYQIYFIEIEKLCSAQESRLPGAIFSLNPPMFMVSIRFRMKPCQNIISSLMELPVSSTTAIGKIGFANRGYP